MARCGINAFEMDATKSVEDALGAFKEFSVIYQADEVQAEPIWRRR